MAVKVADTIESMNPDGFPVVMASGVNLIKEDGSEANLEQMYLDGELGGGGGLIDDTTQSTDTTYSSYKIEEKVAGIIKDDNTSESETWSSKKISEFGEALDKKVEDVDTKVGDLVELKTTEKGSVVGAVNEISDSLVDYDNAKVREFLPSGDMNTFTTEGLYSIGHLNNFTNAPRTTDEHGVLRITKSSSDMVCQEWIPRNGNMSYRVQISGTTWGAWQELVTMDKVVPQVKIENKTTDDARTIIKNSWSTLPTNNSIVRIETSVFTWSAQIYKHDNSWGTIILTCYADNKDSYIGKISNQVWHWYKMGLTEV